MKRTNSKINIIYLNISEKGPSGGGKIIYRHSEIINKLENKFTSQVLHIKKKRYKKWSNSLNKILNIGKRKYYGWNFNDVTISKNFKTNWYNGNINIKNDFCCEK